MSFSSFSSLPEVTPGAHITLNYRLALADGTVIVNTFDDHPATLLLGTGHLAPPLEDIVRGLKAGHHSTFRLCANEAFGERHPDLVQRVSRAALRANGMTGDDFTPGDLIEFHAPDGTSYAGVLKELGETSALFDFNHPLAGQAVEFEVQIIAVL
jgi:FKBP-type peptidyl-prolyl cis-trans isomerase SlpA